MPTRKSNTYLSLVNSYLIDSPQPSSINYWWNLGSLLGLCLVIQIASGVFLAMHYSSNIELAFDSVEHIMRDVNAGWLIRYIHANGASFFFICMYLHIGKALYYGSYKQPRVMLWVIGVVIFILTMAIAFMGNTSYNSPKSFNYINLNKSNLNYINLSPFNKSINYIHKRYLSTKSKSNDILEPSDIFKEIGIEPVVWWDDLHIYKNQMSMHKELKKKTGVYIIINKITRAYYIGSAITNKLYVRYSDHLLYFRGSKPLKESVLEYGLKSFIFGILEYNNNIITKKNRKVLWEIENKYLSLYQPIYNKYPQADSPKGYKHSEESIAKMKLNFTSERKEKYSKMLKVKNIILTSEVKLKLRNLALSRSKDYISEEGKLRQSLSKQVDVNLYLDDTLLCTIKGINKAAHLLCCSYSTIHRSIEKGYIYIPDSLIRYLTNDYINNNNDIISKINKDNKVSKVKYKSGNKDWPDHTKVDIKLV